MKYTSNNMPLYCPQTKSRWYRYASRVKPCGVLWHSTGANNPYIKRYVQPSDNAVDRQYWIDLLGWNLYKNDWNHQQGSSGVHAFIGKFADGTVGTVQCGPWDLAAWGCGSGARGSCNNGWIQFEICEDSLTDPVYAEQVYREGVELTAYLCNLYNLDPKESIRFCGVTTPRILDHKTSATLGVGYPHGDIQHWFPKCIGKNMQTVQKDVAELLEEENMTGEEIYAKLIEYLNMQPTSAYAIDASKRGVERGLWIDDTGDGLLDNPKAPITRQDVNLVFDRLIEKYGLEKEN